jgi:hypothetical protein
MFLRSAGLENECAGDAQQQLKTIDPTSSESEPHFTKSVAV